jgi:hypothetical protein
MISVLLSTNQKLTYDIYQYSWRFHKNSLNSVHCQSQGFPPRISTQTFDILHSTFQSRPRYISYLLRITFIHHMDVIAWVFLQVISFPAKLYKWCCLTHLFIILPNDNWTSSSEKNGDKIPDKLIRVAFPKSLTVLLLFKDQSRCISLSPCIVSSIAQKVFIAGQKNFPAERATKETYAWRHK